MRFMILLKADAASEAGAPPDDAYGEAIAAFHEQLARAGVLLDAAGLHSSASGWRLRYAAGKATRIDGPFADTSALVAGYIIIQVRSRDEALEWSRRLPPPRGPAAAGEIEVRQMVELDEVPRGADLERSRTLAPSA